MYSKQIPDKIFEDFKNNALCESRRRDAKFMKFSFQKYKAYCSQETKDWITDNNFDLKFVAYFVKKNIHTLTIPDCIHCSKQITQKDVWLGHKFCCHYCQTQSEQRKQSARETNLKKYGVDNPTKCKQVIDKRKKNCLEKYGVEHSTQVKEFQEKKKNTLLKNYGVDIPFKNKEILDKARQTTLKHYGVDNPFKTDYFQDLAKQRRKELYGVEYVCQNPEYKEKIRQSNINKSKQEKQEIQDKRKQTCLEKYGVEYSSQSNIIKDKIIKTCNDRYGVNFPAQSPNAIINHKISRYKRFTTNLVKRQNVQLLTSKDELINTNNDLTFKCLSCGYQWTDEQHMCVQQVRCPECISHNLSLVESMIFDYIKSIYPGQVDRHNRKILQGKELDIYIPDLKLAFEYNGSLYHSTNSNYTKTRNIDSNYHLSKTINCQKHNIRLIHIFDYQWYNKQDQIKKFIKRQICDLQYIETKDLKVKTISKFEAKQFLDKYYIDDFNRDYNKQFGIYYSDTLISVITFDVNDNQTVLQNYCKDDIHDFDDQILLDIIKDNKFNSVITSIDLQHFTRNTFSQLGFKFQYQIQPLCHKTNGSKLYDNKYPEYALDVYDCGYLIYKLEI